MRIVIDARNPHGSGIHRYSRQLIEHLQAIDSEHQYVVLLSRPAFESWHLRAPNFRSQLVEQRIYSLGEQSRLLVTLGALAPDLVHFTSFNAPLLYLGRRVTTVHDLTYLEFPSVRASSSLGRVRYAARELAMRAVLRTSLRRSAAVITDSRYVREQLLSRYGGRGSSGPSADRTIAIHCGAARAPLDDTETGATDLPEGVREPYLLYVGHAHPHKNLRLLVEGLQLIRARAPDLRLVIAGPPDSFYDSLREHCRGRPEIVFAGYVSNGDLRTLYRRASLFVLPSLSEGFGLPALEAMGHGAPVLTSNATCLPEVCAEAAEYFDPTDVRDLAQKALALLKSPTRRARLRDAGFRRAADFSWRRMAEQTLDVYRAVLR